MTDLLLDLGELDLKHLGERLEVVLALLQEVPEKLSISRHVEFRLLY